MYQFKVEHSVINGKKRFFKNDCLVYEEQALKKLFMIDFNIGLHNLKITQMGDKFEMHIDNESFMYVYNKIKQKGHFVFESMDGASPDANQAATSASQNKAANFEFDFSGFE